MAITIYGIKNCDTMKKARAWLDKHGVESRARGRGPLAARPRRDHIAAEAVQLQPEVAVRGHLKPQARKRIDGPRREPVPAHLLPRVAALLEHGHRDPLARQPVRRRGTGGASPADQDLHCAAALRFLCSSL